MNDINPAEEKDINIKPIVGWLLLGIFLAGVAAFLYSQNYWEGLIRNKNTNSSNEVVLVIDYGNGTLRKFKGPISDGEKANAWDFLQQSIAVSGIEIKVADNFVPKSIGGFTSGASGKQWALYLNDQKQKFSPFEIAVSPGDKVTFRFE